MKKICFDRILPIDLELNKLKLLAPNTTITTRLAAVAAKQWTNGSTLRIKFVGGTEAQKALVKQFAPEWTQYANLKFVFGDDASAEIRISFDPNSGAWSYIGIDCSQIPRESATMNLGWQDRAVILHEFGHAIGCIHEHQSPAGGIQWNKEQVYADLGGPPNFWDKATVDHNIFEKYNADQLNWTALDPKSIMMYSFPANWTLDGFHTEENTELSPQDKAFIASAKMYPKPAVPEPTLLPISWILEKAASLSVPGEEDVFTLNIPEVNRYAIQTHGSTDSSITVFGPNDHTKLLAKDNDGGEGSNALVTVITPGNYWVHVRHAFPSQTGAYRISVTAPRRV